MFLMDWGLKERVGQFVDLLDCIEKQRETFDVKRKLCFYRTAICVKCLSRLLSRVKRGTNFFIIGVIVEKTRALFWGPEGPARVFYEGIYL